MSTFRAQFCRRASALAALILLEGVVSLWAHDPGLSTASVQLRPGEIEVVLILSTQDVLALAELDSDGNRRISSREFVQGELKICGQATSSLELTADDHPVLLSPVKCALAEGDNAMVHLRSPVGSFSRLRIHSRAMAMLPPGHRQFLTVRSPAGAVLTERLLSAQADSVSLDLNETRESSAVRFGRNAFGEFVFLGLKHILLGYDHLLFLVSVLIVSRGLTSTLKIITCFTVAHSITLALATFELVQVPGRVVEPLIAVSIVFVALENIVRGDAPKGRLLLVFAFGLIHGLGFASVLREFGVASAAAGVAVPLFSFNLGVELGQLLVAALLIPVFRMVREVPGLASRWIPASSVAVALAGTYWLVQRVCFS